MSNRSIPLWITSLAFISANLGAQEVLGMAASGAKYGMYTTHYYWLGAAFAMVFLGIFMMPFIMEAKPVVCRNILSFGLMKRPGHLMHFPLQ